MPQSTISLTEGLTNLFVRKLENPATDLPEWQIALMIQKFIEHLGLF